jgi:Flp pilus assembly protein TadB
MREIGDDMTREQALLAAFAAGAVAIVSAIAALTGNPMMWWTFVVMILLLVVLVARLQRGREAHRGLGPEQERIDESHP